MTKPETRTTGITESERTARETVEKRFGLKDAVVAALDGYANANYKVVDGKSACVLKLYTDRPGLEEILSAESDVLLRVASERPVGAPVPLADVSGQYVTRLEEGGGWRYARLLTFLEGELFGNVELTPDLLYSFGDSLARLDKCLEGVNAPALAARRSVWDLQHHALNLPLAEMIPDVSDRRLVEYFFSQAREKVDPRLPFLRRSLIHGDANEWNVLVSEGKVSGIIDFGDLYFTPLINEVAVAAAYTLLYVTDIVEGAIPLVRGYTEVNPLREEEISLLYYLIALRLCTSVCNAAKARREMPGNEYAFVSEERAWSTLWKWIEINPDRITDLYMTAAGLEEAKEGSIETSLSKRRSGSSGSLSLQFDEPIKMKGAAFQYMYDAYGKTYLDCYNNIPQVGHCHPSVTRAISSASASLNTNTRYLTDAYNEYTERLLARFPESLNKVFLVNSGSAATDLAMRLAKGHTGRSAISVLEHGYHGNTLAGVGVSHYKYSGPGGGGSPEDVVELPIPDTYKGRFCLDDGSAGASYAAEAAEKLRASGKGLAGFIAEPIVGCGGQVPLAGGYLKDIYKTVRGLGGVCISDEVQTGFGRLGDWFWGFEMHGVTPDIVVLGKPMGNGHPVGAVVTTDEIAASFENGMEFFSSFGGNTVSCLVCAEVLNVLESDRLTENASEVGGYLLERLRSVVAEYESAGDARGAGLFLGLEIVKDADSREPDGGLAKRIQEELKEAGVLVGIDGPAQNVIKIKPPLCFTKANADRLVEGIEKALAGAQRIS